MTKHTLNLRFTNRGIFSLLKARRQTLDHTQPPIELIPGVLLLGQSDQSVKLNAHLYVVSRIRMNGAIRLLRLYAFMYSTRCASHGSFCYQRLEPFVKRNVISCGGLRRLAGFISSTPFRFTVGCRT